MSTLGSRACWRGTCCCPVGAALGRSCLDSCVALVECSPMEGIRDTEGARVGLQIHNALMAALPQGHTTKCPWLRVVVRTALHVPMGRLHCVGDTDRARMGMQVDSSAGWVCAWPVQAHAGLWAQRASSMAPGLGAAQGLHAWGDSKHCRR